MSQRKLAVFNLPRDIRDNEVEDLFSKFGRTSRIAVRSIRDGAMAFVEFDDARDAEDALNDRHGYDFQGGRLRVEFSNPGGASKGKGRGGGRNDSRRRGGGRGDSRRRGGGRGGGRRDDSRRRGGGRGRGKGDRKGSGKASKGGLHADYYKIEVENLPSGSSWQDLKDFFRTCKDGQVKFTEVNGNVGTGGFSSRENAEAVMDELDNTTFTNRSGDKETVKLTLIAPEGGRADSPARDRSRSRSGKRSRSPSPKNDGDRSAPRSRSRSPSGNRSGGD